MGDQNTALEMQCTAYGGIDSDFSRYFNENGIYLLREIDDNIITPDQELIIPETEGRIIKLDGFFGKDVHLLRRRKGTCYNYGPELDVHVYDKIIHIDDNGTPIEIDNRMCREKLDENLFKEIEGKIRKKGCAGCLHPKQEDVGGWFSACRLYKPLNIPGHTIKTPIYKESNDIEAELAELSVSQGIGFR